MTVPRRRAAETGGSRWPRRLSGLRLTGLRHSLVALLVVTVVAVATGAGVLISQSDEATLVSEDAPATGEPGATTSAAGLVTEAPVVPVVPGRTLRALPKRDRAGLAELARLAEEAAVPAQPPAAVFRPATLNVLGASHTARGGNKPGYGSGEARMNAALGLLNSNGVDLVALQEFEAVQKGAFNRITGGSWDFHSGSARARDAVAWRTSTWELVEAGARNVPYFGGEIIPMPWVLLRHRETGREVYAMSLHNPTSNPRRGNNARFRAAATNIQIALARELGASGRPVLVMGDFNETGVAFCRVAGAGLVAANGGSGSPCSPPRGMGIDWIFGLGDLVFSSYARISGGRATDHPLVVSTATHGGPVPEALLGSE